MPAERPLLGVTINGLLDAQNMRPLAERLWQRAGIRLELATYDPNLAKATDQYGGLVVGQDWHLNTELVVLFKLAELPTILLQSEGLFLSEEHWYRGTAPLCDLVLTWGRRHADIFRRRGYQGRLVVTGPPRFDRYHDFRPTLTRAELLQRLELAAGSRLVVFLCQFFPEHEFGPRLKEIQILLTQAATRTPDALHPVIKCHPQEYPDLYIDRQAIVTAAGGRDVTVLDIPAHTETIEISTMLYHADLAITYSSTTAFEAILLGTPVLLFDPDGTSPLGDGRFARLPTFTSWDRMPGKGDALGQAPLIKAALQELLPMPLDGANTDRAADAVLDLLRHWPPPLAP